MSDEIKNISALADRFYQGYLAHTAAIMVAADARAMDLAPEIEDGQLVPLGYVERKDGTQYQFSFPFFLDLAANDPLIADNMKRTWLATSLLALGDELAKQNYLDKPPILELVRHLRNGIAHGNRFDIREPDKLIEFPANNREVLSLLNHDGRVFEITPELNGTCVLFDYMMPGDVLDVLLTVSLYLGQMA